MARWYEGTGNPCEVRLATAPLSGKPDRVDLQEQPVSAEKAGIATGGAVPTRAWEIVTVRMQSTSQR